MTGEAAKQVSGVLFCVFDLRVVSLGEIAQAEA